MKRFLHQQLSIESQTVRPFTGEGAYHGSTKPRKEPRGLTRPPPVEEMLPSTLARYAAAGQTTIQPFTAVFPNTYCVRARLPVPSQDEIRNDGVTLCWCPIELALQEAGPLTRSVLQAMSRELSGTKKFIYIDAKIQYFEPGDVPVDSYLWHVDGSIVARDARAQALGHPLLHDMAARLQGSASPPTYLSYQSSSHCATRFATSSVSFALPELIPNFDLLDEKVRALAPTSEAQPAASIVRFDGRALHRATPASGAGWRLWVRCIETDREAHLNASIINCYGTVFRLPRGLA
ncbi:MAG: hypothetical protein ACPG4T_20015 [Nannocystaceae bacterium]